MNLIKLPAVCLKPLLQSRIVDREIAREDGHRSGRDSDALSTGIKRERLIPGTGDFGLTEP